MFKFGLLNPKTQNQLDYCLGLTTEQFLERRLQTQVHKLKLASSIHQARTRVKHRHIAVNNQLVNVASFVVTVENEQKIQYAMTSPFAEGRLSRKQKFNAKNN